MPDEFICFFITRLMEALLGATLSLIGQIRNLAVMVKITPI